MDINSYKEISIDDSKFVKNKKIEKTMINNEIKEEINSNTT
jgi:hypothetical protein